MKREIFPGKQFGRWTVSEKVFSRITPSGTTKPYWLCNCDCGVTREVRAEHLCSGRSLSCGCHKRDAAAAQKRTHGGRETKLYDVWTQMIQRCHNPRNKAYADYGGRGIAVCERWRDFAAFMGDMGHPPAGKSIDRVNNDAGYSPDNCRWATPLEQAKNKRPYGTGSRRKSQRDVQ